jgi:hypothetical protein
VLVYHIGLLWSATFKEQLKGFLTRSWKPSTTPLSAEQKKRRDTFIGTDSGTIGEYRRQYQHGIAFLGLLGGEDGKAAGSYDDDGAGDAGQATNAKGRLLDQLNTDMLFGRSLHDSFTVVLSDFEWFGPSLDHGILLAVLEFFGVPDNWLAFFHTFLKVPIRFEDDPADTEPRTRRRGTPVSHSLSTLLGETLLFVMDFAVNQRANGLFLYRIHDDLWLWDHDAERVLAGWNEMQTFASLAGLTFNKEKTGSATIGGEHLDGLPAGDVRWGLLVLDPKKGQFVVDDDMVNKHIAELRRQLASAQSVFGVINRYNFYLRFIARNLAAEPANSFGRAHIDQTISALSRVQRSMFDEGDIIDHLKKMVAERFGITDTPLGWYFIPNALGGLGLHNPLIELLLLREKIVQDPIAEVKKSLESDVDDFRRSKDNYSPTATVGSPEVPWDMSFEEYISGRENASNKWQWVYYTMLADPDPADVEETGDVTAAIAVLSQSSSNTVNQYTDFSELSLNDKWVITFYCAELTAKFGSFAIVDPALIPVGMLQVFQETKVRWEQ